MGGGFTGQGRSCSPRFPNTPHYSLRFFSVPDPHDPPSLKDPVDLLCLRCSLFGLVIVGLS